MTMHAMKTCKYSLDFSLNDMLTFKFGLPGPGINSRSDEYTRLVVARVRLCPSRVWLSVTQWCVCLGESESELRHTCDDNS